MFVIGAVAAAVTIAVLPAPHLEYGTFFTALLSISMIALHARPKRNVHGRQVVETIQLDEILFVPTFIMLTPLQAIVVLVPGSVVASVLARRDPYKAAFNVGQLVFAGCVGLWFVYLTGIGITTQPDLTDALVGMAAAVIVTAITGLLVRAILAFMNRSAFWPMVKELRSRFGPWTGAVTLGGIASIAVGVEPLAAVLALILIVFVHRAFAAVVVEQSARVRSEKVQQSIAALRAHTDPARVRADLLETAQNLLAARDARIVPKHTSDPARAVSAPLGNGERLRVENRTGPDQWDSDNRNRTVSEIRHAFSKNGGNMGEQGSVAWMFERKSQIFVPSEKAGEDQLMGIVLDAGADDLRDDGDRWMVVSPPGSARSRAARRSKPTAFRPKTPASR